MSGLYNVIKNIAVQANDSEKNDKMLTATVTSCKVATPNDDGSYTVTLNPFELRLSDKILFKDGDSFLIMTKTMRQQVDNIQPPLYFSVGDRVLLMRIDQGKRYLLIDKVE